MADGVSNKQVQKVEVWSWEAEQKMYLTLSKYPELLNSL